MDQLEKLTLNSRNHTQALYLIASSLEVSIKNQIVTFQSLGFDTLGQMMELQLHVVQELMAKLNQMKIRGD